MRKKKLQVFVFSYDVSSDKDSRAAEVQDALPMPLAIGRISKGALCF